MTRRVSTVVITLALIAAGSLSMGTAVAAAPAGTSFQLCSQFNAFARYLRGTNGQAILNSIQQNCATSNATPSVTPSTCIVPSASYATIADAFADTNCTDVDLAQPTTDESGIVASHDVNLHGHGRVIDGGLSGDSIITVNSGVTLNVDGVRFVNGFAADGGGAIINNGTLSVTKSLFDSNDMDTTGTPDGSGGAIDNFGNATISFSLFTHNNGVFGGAIGNEDSGSLSVSGVIFASNNAADTGGSGGAIQSSGELEVQNAIFAFNATGGAGGAMSLNNSGSISNGLFLGNVAADGGAINFQADGTLTLVSAFFINNSATNNGGAIKNYFVTDVNNEPTNVVGDVSASNSLFQANRTMGVGVGIGNGGAIWNSGGFTMTSSQVTGNLTAVYGGGIFTTGSGEFQLTDSAVTGNRSFVAGGGIYNDGATVTLTNSTVSDNTPNQCAPTNSVPGC